MKQNIIKILLISLIIMVSFGAGFGASQWWRSKNRPVLSLMATTAGLCSYNDKKDISIALEYLYAAIFLDPENSDARYALGYVYYDQGLNDPAIHEFEKYLQMPYKGVRNLDNNKLDTKTEKHIIRERAEAYCFIGDIYERKGDKQTSTTNYKKAAEADPEYTKFLETFIEYINDKTEKKDTDLNKLEIFSKRLTRIREAEKGT